MQPLPNTLIIRSLHSAFRRDGELGLSSIRGCHFTRETLDAQEIEDSLDLIRSEFEATKALDGIATDLTRADDFKYESRDQTGGISARARDGDLERDGCLGAYSKTSVSADQVEFVDGVVGDGAGERLYIRSTPTGVTAVAIFPEDEGLVRQTFRFKP